MHTTVAKIPSELIIREVELPGGAKWSGVIKRGTALRITDLGGSKGVSGLFYNATDTSERYNAADTVKIQWNIRLSEGKLLLSDMGRILFSITADTCGCQDTLCGCSNRNSNLKKYGGPYFRNGRDNFLIELGKHGLGKRDIMPNINFFSKVGIGSEGGLQYIANASKSGDFIDLRAEMDVLTVLSNTPHILDPETVYNPCPVRLTVWHSPEATTDDPCRTSSPEARRAYENTLNFYL